MPNILLPISKINALNWLTIFLFLFSEKWAFEGES